MNWPRQRTERLDILRAHDHFHEWRSLDAERVCAVCGRVFSGHEIEISQKGEEFKLNCPTKECFSGIHQWVYPDSHLPDTNSENWWRALSSNDGSEPSSPQCQQI